MHLGHLSRPAHNPTHKAGHQEFAAIQALRGIAAVLVVICHCFVRLAEQANVSMWQTYLNGASGVDLFFVISGFVMVVSSQKLAKAVSGWRTFIQRRIIRIVPLYWLVTTVKLILVTLQPGVALHAHYSLANIIWSYLFVPSRNLIGDLRPILTAGWTLSYEMLFYIMFAFTLFMRQPPLRILAPFFIFLAIIGSARTDQWPAFTSVASDLPIEFLYGVAIGLLTLKGYRLNPLFARIAIVLGLCIMLSVPSRYCFDAVEGMGRTNLRVILWGIPAALVVASCVSMDERWSKLLPRWLLGIGYASYSIYLIHPFVTPVIGGAIAYIHVSDEITKALMVILSVPISCIAGYVLYRIVEFPMTEMLKKRMAKASMPIG